jgi:hypothetical protein
MRVTYKVELNKNEDHTLPSTAVLASAKPFERDNDPTIFEVHHSRKHKSGWTISGEIEADGFTIVKPFHAIHEKLGFVDKKENTLEASSPAALTHFLETHPLV